MSTQRIVKKIRDRLTLDYNILTGLLVALTSATDPVREDCNTRVGGSDTTDMSGCMPSNILNRKDQ